MGEGLPFDAALILTGIPAINIVHGMLGMLGGGILRQFTIKVIRVDRIRYRKVEPSAEHPFPP